MERPIQISVRYHLREYLELVREHLPTALRERGKKSDPIGLGNRLMLVVLVPPIFLFKKWRVGDCLFEVGADGITRRSRRGQLHVSWRDITAIRRYGNAYLVVTKRGALPLPYRCFSAVERKHFDHWIAKTCMAA
ncbi:YcxB-like protein [Roseateles sp. YR242]|uniref:YcxB family protein n=1 Tax=Roseateles sp. YR242 TaxID=1855305 RepID=UPI0008C70139|nr:YcxB family protein [Roseateles sp. YR242]SEK65788.1 YcxB-like protein [Roseateles sp. YR242]